MTEKIAVLGAGSWGTTLAILLSCNGREVSLWEHLDSACQDLNAKRENANFLPGIKIPPDIFISSNLSDIIDSSSVIVLAVPSHVIRPVCETLAQLDIRNRLIISVAKGIENDTLMRMSEVISEILVSSDNQNRVGVLSGPSHAEEVSVRMPTSIVAAATDNKIARKIQEIFINEYFRVYTNNDVIGVELGGALKNIIALAAGIVDGLGFGDNTKAALLTRGIAEISRLGGALGANPSTFSGLSGIGDLIVTCTSRHSRNRRMGEMIGQGLSLEEALTHMTMVAEGVKTTTSAYQLAKKIGVEMPITNQVYRVLFEGYNAKHAVKELMTREAKPEMAEVISN